MEFSKGQHENWQTVQANLKGRDFFRPGPLMRVLECERPCVLLIDELDKVDESFEAMLLEILSAWQLSIPEFGTVTAKSIPFVVLTSNEERRLGDPSGRRSLYVRVEHPTPEREAEIIASRTPQANEEFHREMAGIALLRQVSNEHYRIPFVGGHLGRFAALRRERHLCGYGRCPPESL
jgi:MoxR-like ATPase